MEILFIAIAAVLSVYVVSRVTGGTTEAMLKQYEIFTKRFGLEQKTAHSKWGAGIGEHHSLKGEYNGYPVSLYDHYTGKGPGKKRWTSLTFETLFTDKLEFVLEGRNGQIEARYQSAEEAEKVELGEGLAEIYELRSNDSGLAKVMSEEGISYRLEGFAKNETAGCIRLSKGFLEYREMGRMTKEVQRARFQQVIVLLSELADGLSVYCSKQKSL